MPAPRLRRLPSNDLSEVDIATVRRLLAEAFGDDPDDAFTDDDWGHALGGVHFLAELDGDIVGHASVVERELRVGGRPLRTGYVEAVGVAPALQRHGIGTALMRAVTDQVRDGYELGALGTGEHGFYERFGWFTWRGPSSVWTPRGVIPTPDEDGYIMVLRTQTSPELDLDAPITCDWRPGDVW